MPHRIAQEYNNMKLLFSRSALSDDVTRKFISINELCKTEIARMHVLPITSGSTAVGKNYMVFSLTGNIVDKHSRPVNSDLYNAGNQLDATGKTKVDIFFENLLRNQIPLQSAQDITEAMFVVGEADRIENQMVVNMSLVNMGGKYKLVLATQYFFCQLHPDLMGILGGDLSRLKGLDQVAAQVCALVDGMAACPFKFNVGGFSSTTKRGYQQFSICLIGITDIVNSCFQR